MLRFALAALLAANAAAAAPRVAVDMAPLHSLAAQVMEGVGEPALILPPGASPHDHALRPSEATALAEAEVVIRIGGGLAPWFDEARQALAPEAVDVEVAEAPGVLRLPVREGGGFGGHDHQDDDHGHDHGPVDPHLWLDPENARAGIAAIAEALAEADPENAGAYAANARAAEARLIDVAREIDRRLAPVRGRPFLVFHDAYQYFERRFDIPALGAVSAADAAPPGAKRIAAMRALASQAACIFAEPQFEPRLVATIAEGTGARVATLDPAGAGLAPGPGFYAALLGNLADDLAGCLSGG